MSDRQERLDHHASWMRIEDDEVRRAFTALVKKTKAEVAPHIQTAWTTSTIQSDEEMNVGLRYPVNISAEVDAYISAVKKRFASWKLWA